MNTVSNKADDSASIFEVAKLTRKEILQYRQWKFEGSFSEFQVPRSLATLLEWIIAGSKPSLKSRKKKSVTNIVNNIAEIIMRATKTKRQVNDTDSDSSFRDVIEKPLFLLDLES